MKKYEDALYKKLTGNPFVYHYTSIEALFSILEGYRRNGLYALPFRAHSVYNTNDSREMELGFATVKDILPAFEKSYSHNMNLSEIYENPEYETECKNQCFPKPEDGLIEVGSVPYTISFACKRDFLPMWSMYGDHKKGVCIKFDINKLIDRLVGNVQLCFVHYENNKDNIIEDYLLPELYDFDAKRSKTGLSIKDKIEELSLLCDCIAPFVKCKDWSYEEEFRLVYHEHYGPNYTDDFFRGLKIHLHLKKIKVNEFVCLPIFPDSIEEIIIGPLANFEVIEHILDNELKECNLNSVTITPSCIQITK